MMRALLFGTVSLVAVECLALDATSAFAGPTTCSVPAINGGIPVGNFLVLQNTTSHTGTLANSSSSVESYPVCQIGSVNVIPFGESKAVTKAITIAEEFLTGGYFQLIVDLGTANAQTFSRLSGTAGFLVASSVHLLSGLNTLDVTEFNSSFPSAGGGSDAISATITNFNFIPEPATLGLLGFAAASLISLRRKRLPADANVGRSAVRHCPPDAARLPGC